MTVYRKRRSQRRQLTRRRSQWGGDGNSVKKLAGLFGATVKRPTGSRPLGPPPVPAVAVQEPVIVANANKPSGPPPPQEEQDPLTGSLQFNDESLYGEGDSRPDDNKIPILANAIPLKAIPNIQEAQEAYEKALKRGQLNRYARGANISAANRVMTGLRREFGENPNARGPWPSPPPKGGSRRRARRSKNNRKTRHG
jgi:hypothetical protein